MPHSVTSTSDISGIRKCTRKIRPRRKLAATPVAQIIRDGRIYHQDVMCGIGVLSGTNSSADLRACGGHGRGPVSVRFGWEWFGPGRGANLGPDNADRTGYGPGPEWCGPGRNGVGRAGASLGRGGRAGGGSDFGLGQTSGWVRLRVGSDFGLGQTSGRGISGLVRRERSSGRAERMRDWMSSLTSQTLTFMPATTVPRESQKAMNSRPARSPR
jgi:hypothetical protein